MADDASSVGPVVIKIICSSDESSSDREVEITSEEPTSMLQKLRASKVSDLCMKRYIQCNPPTGKKRSCG